jgi:hypothetical protein
MEPEDSGRPNAPPGPKAEGSIEWVRKPSDEPVLSPSSEGAPEKDADGPDIMGAPRAKLVRAPPLVLPGVPSKLPSPPAIVMDIFIRCFAFSCAS